MISLNGNDLSAAREKIKKKLPGERRAIGHDQLLDPCRSGLLAMAQGVAILAGSTA